MLALFLGMMKAMNTLKDSMMNLQLPLAKQLLPLVSMVIMVKEN